MMPVWEAWDVMGITSRNIKYELEFSNAWENYRNVLAKL
jgi:hypothetical protein